MLLLIAFKSTAVCTNSEANFEGGQMRWGECIYKKYNGYAKIISIEKTATPQSYKNQSYESYDIRFSFTLSESIIEQFSWIVEKNHQLRLANSWYPGPRFMKKYCIEVGKSFECNVKIITKGTCTPVLFEFQGIAIDDYFEIKK